MRLIRLRSIAQFARRKHLSASHKRKISASLRKRLNRKDRRALKTYGEESFSVQGKYPTLVSSKRLPGYKLSRLYIASVETPNKVSRIDYLHNRDTRHTIRYKRMYKSLSRPEVFARKLTGMW